MIHSRKLQFIFYCSFSKNICPFCKVQRQTNKTPLAIYIDFPKFSFKFYIEEETSLQPFFRYHEVRLGHVQSSLSVNKTEKKVLELSKSDHAVLRYLKVDVVMGVKLAKKWQKGGKKGCKRVTRWR